MCEEWWMWRRLREAEGDVPRPRVERGGQQLARVELRAHDVSDSQCGGVQLASELPVQAFQDVQVEAPHWPARIIVGAQHRLLVLLEIDADQHRTARSRQRPRVTQKSERVLVVVREVAPAERV